MYVSSLAGGRQADSGTALEAIAKSFAYALEDIPTHHLEECFRRAIREKTDDFPLTAASVNRAYNDMLPELQRRAQQNTEYRVAMLKEGYGSLGNMGIVEFKQRHNLPQAWQLGDPYPPESDLYNG